MNQTIKTPPAAASEQDSVLSPTDTFVRRHIGPNDAEIAEMLKLLGYDSLDALIDATIPSAIRLKRDLKLGPERGEHELLQQLKETAKKNKVFRSFIGQGYHSTI